MDDRELLKLAAKAADLLHWEYVENDYRDGRKVTGFYDSLLEVCWNPLRNDGDALRLAITLHLPISFPLRTKEEPARVHCGRYRDNSAGVWYPFEELFGGDPYAATRRAIVRAAAEIGRAMP